MLIAPGVVFITLRDKFMSWTDNSGANTSLQTVWVSGAYSYIGVSGACIHLVIFSQKKPDCQSFLNYNNGAVECYLDRPYIH